MAGDTLPAAEPPIALSEFALATVLAAGASGSESLSMGAVSNSEEATETDFKGTSFAATWSARVSGFVTLGVSPESAEQHKVRIADNSKTHLRNCRQGTGSEL